MEKELEKKPPVCVHCGKEMTATYGNNNFAAPFCADPSCPNYGLLQIGAITEAKENKVL